MPPGRVTVFDADAVDALTPAQCRDAIAATAPGAIVTTGASARIRLRGAIDVDRPVLCPEATSDTEAPLIHGLGDVEMAVAGSHESLAVLSALDAEDRLDPATETYVLSDLLALSIRPTELATVREGLEEYRRALETDGPPAETSLAATATHLSTALPASYYGEWEGLTVRGAAPSDLDGAPAGGDAGESAVASLQLGPDGVVASERIRRDSLGLRAIDGVGEQRARTLRDAGYADRESLAGADVATIADLDGVGRQTAARLVDRARAFEDGTVLRRTDERLPGADPVFVDIETDGLSPSVVWLIGVLDPAAGDDLAGHDERDSARYRSFVARDPERPGAALEAFCEWYADHASDRPIAAYNGETFDFPVLAEQIERRCPEFRDLWASVRTADPYSWAVRDGNAVLPGRTNRLEDVADALGFDARSEASGSDDRAPPLDGAEVARIYREWQADPVAANEPDWERLNAYCKGDVRALAHVYEAIESADRIDGEHRQLDRSPRTTQGSLGDFG